jgi:hypothetical protein
MLVKITPYRLNNYFTTNSNLKPNSSPNYKKNYFMASQVKSLELGPEA